MTYAVEGPIILGDVRVTVVSQTDISGAALRGVPVFAASKAPLWIIIGSGQVVHAMDMSGETVDPAVIEAAAPGATAVR